MGFLKILRLRFELQQFLNAIALHDFSVQVENNSYGTI